MDYGDFYWRLYRDYYRDPFPHSLLRTRQFSGSFSGSRVATNTTMMTLQTEETEHDANLLQLLFETPTKSGAPAGLNKHLGLMGFLATLKK